MPKTASKSPESSGKDATGSPSQHPESTSPADTLISDFKYPEQRTTHFCCLNPPVCGALPWQPQEINIPLTKKFYHTLILLSIFPGFSSHPNPRRVRRHGGQSLSHLKGLSGLIWDVQYCQLRWWRRIWHIILASLVSSSLQCYGL